MRRHARRVRRGSLWLSLSLLAAALALTFVHFRDRPWDLPWTPLDLSEPTGLFTGRKLAALGKDYPQCRELLARAGVRFVAVGPLELGQCGYRDGIQLTAGGARTIFLHPDRPKMACPVAAALSMWEWNVVQPAAIRSFGQRVVTFEQLGTYNCRSIAGRGALSQHAHARAIDIAGFVLADGRRITVAQDWNGGGGKAAFLREARDGACGLFSTTLSPDYNAAHRDHLHLDEAPRGGMAWRACR